MLVASPALEAMAAREGADERPFREHFEKKDRRRREQRKDDDEGNDIEEEGICVFDNLGKDATLVVPAYQDQGDKDTYCHFLSYLIAPSVPTKQKLSLLQRVAQVTLDRCIRKEKKEKGEEEEEELVWVSTSGLGVAWLHVRVEDRPKYYTWQEYVARGRTGKRGGGKR